MFEEVTSSKDNFGEMSIFNLIVFYFGNKISIINIDLQLSR